MTEVNPCGWLQNAGATHTAAQMRTYLGALLGGVLSAGAITRTRGGVHPQLGVQLQVTANGTPNMSVNVATGVAFIPGTENGAQGTYFVENDATVNLSINTAPGAGLNRIDIVVAKVQDQFYSGATNAWSLAVVAGTAAASPSAPSAPNNAIILAQVFVGALVSSITTGNITDTRFYASTIGGPARCLSTARPSNPGAGDLIFETDTGRNQQWNGSSWFWPMGRGVIGGKQYTGGGNFAVGLTTTELLVNMDSGTVSLEPSRRFKINVKFKVNYGSTPQVLIMHIRDTNLAGTIRTEAVFDAANTGAGHTLEFSARYETTIAETKTFVVSGATQSGTVNLIGAGTSNPMWVEVEDIGPSGVITITATP